MGVHSSIRETFAKLRQVCWWPSVDKGVAGWVGGCSSCRLLKLSKALSTAQRTELHNRPFRVLFVDAVGPISPEDEGMGVLLHAEDPFTRAP